jgi:hypothetical protein
MSDNFGVPSSDFETLDNYPSSASYGTPSGGGKKSTLIIIIIVIIILCCLCVVGGGVLYGLWTYGDAIVEQLSSLIRTVRVI